MLKMSVETVCNATTAVLGKQKKRRLGELGASLQWWFSRLVGCDDGVRVGTFKSVALEVSWVISRVPASDKFKIFSIIHQD